MFKILRLFLDWKMYSHFSSRYGNHVKVFFLSCFGGNRCSPFLDLGPVTITRATGTTVADYSQLSGRLVVFRLFLGEFLVCKIY